MCSLYSLFVQLAQTSLSTLFGPVMPLTARRVVLWGNTSRLALHYWPLAPSPPNPCNYHRARDQAPWRLKREINHCAQLVAGAISTHTFPFYESNLNCSTQWLYSLPRPPRHMCDWYRCPPSHRHTGRRGETYVSVPLCTHVCPVYPWWSSLLALKIWVIIIYLK